MTTVSTGPFTELNARRLGPVRRFFVGHPRAMDAVVVVVAALFAVAGALSPGQSSRPALSASLAVAAALALVWRRSRPALVAEVVSLLGAVAVAATGAASGMEVTLGFALYCVAAELPTRSAWLTAGLATLFMVPAVWFWEQPSPDPLAGNDGGTLTVNGEAALTDDRVGTLVGLLIVALAAMAIGTSVRNRRQHLSELLDRANALAKDRDQQAELARAAERTRIAREMHDVVAHSISVMITLADGAAAALDRSPDRSRVALTELSTTGRSALGDMRRVLGALQAEAPLEPTLGDHDLETLVERFRTAGVPVRAEGLRAALPEDTGLRLAVYRVVQEALTNVLRHAPGTPRVDLAVRHVPGRWEVEVVDHGPAVPPMDAGGAGLGLIGMRERAAVLGGTVDAGPWDHGWRVLVTLPTHDEEDR